MTRIMAHKGHPLGRIGKLGVNMAMDKITRFEPADEFQKALETPVTSVFRIVDMPGRRMGDHNIHAPL